MKTALIAACLAVLVAPPSMAQNSWADQVSATALAFAGTQTKENGMEFSVRHFYPPLLEKAAQMKQMEPADLQAEMRAGFKNASRLLSVTTHAHIDEARFGDSAGIEWAAVPISSTAQARERRQIISSGCYWLFVFSADGSVYYNTLSDVFITNAMKQVFPASIIRDLGALGDPDCAPGLS